MKFYCFLLSGVRIYKFKIIISEIEECLKLDERKLHNSKIEPFKKLGKLTLCFVSALIEMIGRYLILTVHINGFCNKSHKFQ